MTPDDVFGSPARILAPTSSNLAVSSSNLTANPQNLTEKRDLDGCLISDQLDLAVVDDLSQLSARLRSTLEAVATEPRAKGKVDRNILIGVVLQLCTGRFITLSCLAELVQRKPETLRNQYLTKLVRDRRLALAFPKTPTHERQAYCTDDSQSK